MVSDLEICIPSDKWLPISRVNVTKQLIYVIEQLIQRCDEELGANRSKHLQIVLEKVAKWKTQFGQSLPEHTFELSNEFIPTVLSFNPESPDLMLKIAKENESIFCQSSIDILSDWIIVGEDLGRKQIVGKLRLNLWFKSSIKTSPEISLIDFSSDDNRKEMIEEVLTNIFGFDNIKSYEDLWTKLQTLPDDEFINVLQKAIQPFRKFL